MFALDSNVSLFEIDSINPSIDPEVFLGQMREILFWGCSVFKPFQLGVTRKPSRGDVQKVLWSVSK